MGKEILELKISLEPNDQIELRLTPHMDGLGVSGLSEGWLLVADDCKDLIDAINSYSGFYPFRLLQMGRTDFENAWFYAVIEFPKRFDDGTNETQDKMI